MGNAKCRLLWDRGRLCRPLGYPQCLGQHLAHSRPSVSIYQLAHPCVHQALCPGARGGWLASQQNRQSVTSKSDHLELRHRLAGPRPGAHRRVLASRSRVLLPVSKKPGEPQLPQRALGEVEGFLEGPSPAPGCRRHSGGWLPAGVTSAGSQ